MCDPPDEVSVQVPDSLAEAVAAMGPESDGSDDDLEPPRSNSRAQPQLAGASEVDHTGLISLRWGHSPGGPCQVLVNSVLLELVHLSPPMQGEWKLKLAGAFSFVISQGRECQWASSHLQHAMWKDSEGREFVASKQRDDGNGEMMPAVKLTWLSDWQAQRFPRWIRWPAGPGCPALPVAKVCVRNTSADGMRLFWDPRHFQVHCTMACQDPSWVAKQAATWQKAFRVRFGLMPVHWQMRELKVTDRRFSSTSSAVSTANLLFLLLHWSCKCRNTVDVNAPLNMLAALCDYSFAEAELLVDRGPGRDGVVARQGSLVKYADRELHFYDEVPGVADEGAQMDFAATMVQLYSTKVTDGILGSIVFGLAQAIEDSLPKRPWLENPLELLSAIADMRSKGSPIDCDVARAIRAMEGSNALRSSKHANKVTKALGLNVGMTSDKFEAQELRRLVFAIRLAMADTTDFGLAVDAKRFGGKHWLAGCISSGQSGKCSITNPVVHRGWDDPYHSKDRP